MALGGSLLRIDCAPAHSNLQAFSLPIGPNCLLDAAFGRFRWPDRNHSAWLLYRVILLALDHAWARVQLRKRRARRVILGEREPQAGVSCIEVFQPRFGIAQAHARASADRVAHAVADLNLRDLLMPGK